jgi:hypothetical protein
LTTSPTVTLDELADLTALIRRYGEPIGDGMVRVEVRLCLTVPESDADLPPIEQETLMAFRQVWSNVRRAVPTRAVAARLFVSRGNAWRRLRSLERRGVIERVGERGGWVLAEQNET